MRHVVAWIKQQVENKYVDNIDWVCSQDMLADVFTKKNVKTDDIVDAITKGHINNL